MRLVATADFHGSRPEIPECDLLLLAGDVGLYDERDLNRFGDWLAEQPAAEIVGIAGNHDLVAPRARPLLRELPWTYLEDEAVVHDGLTIYGTPWTPTFGGWPFMRPDPELAPVFEAIPADVDVLMTHGPPLGILDRSSFGDQEAGSRTLWESLRRLKRLKLHVFGHIHEQAGRREDLRWNGDVKLTFANVGHVGGHAPQVFEL